MGLPSGSVTLPAITASGVSRTVTLACNTPTSSMRRPPSLTSAQLLQMRLTFW
jgi:hypothetical protein